MHKVNLAPGVILWFAVPHRSPTPIPSVCKLRTEHFIGAGIRASNICFEINIVTSIICGIFLADGVGFEPTVGLHPRRFSRPVP